MERSAELPIKAFQCMVKLQETKQGKKILNGGTDMANDIQSAGKEMVAEAMKEQPEPKKKSNMWMGFVAIGFVAGAIFGLLMNLNIAASAQAKEICGTCQENLGIMVGNFNILAKNCSEAQAFRDVKILPALGLNETIRVYT